MGKPLDPSVTHRISRADAVAAARRHREAGPFKFAYCDVFTFRGDLISRVESYVVSLPGEPGQS